MGLKGILMSLLSRRALLDEDRQRAREDRTEAARQRAIDARIKAEAYEVSVAASTDRVAQVRKSFERANRRLANR